MPAKGPCPSCKTMDCYHRMGGRARAAKAARAPGGHFVERAQEAAAATLKAVPSPARAEASAAKAARAWARHVVAGLVGSYVLVFLVNVAVLTMQSTEAGASAFTAWNLFGRPLVEPYVAPLAALGGETPAPMALVYVVAYVAGTLVGVGLAQKHRSPAAALAEGRARAASLARDAGVDPKLVLALALSVLGAGFLWWWFG